MGKRRRSFVTQLGHRIPPSRASRTVDRGDRQKAEMAKKQEAAPTPKNVPSHGVFVVENDGPNAYWTRVGCA